jgi:hypothetical protein
MGGRVLAKASCAQRKKSAAWRTRRPPYRYRAAADETDYLLNAVWRDHVGAALPDAELGLFGAIIPERKPGSWP